MSETHGARAGGSPSAAPTTTATTAAAEIVTARKISRTTAHAAPVRHYRAHSKSNSAELRSHAQAKSAADDAAAYAAASSSPRVLPSPVPPPAAALPPTPGLGSVASPALASPTIMANRRSSSGSSFAAPSLLSRSIRKTLRHLSASLTHHERSELVQKILADLRPAQTSGVVPPFSRASRNSSLPPTHHHSTAAQVKMLGSPPRASQEGTSSDASSCENAIPIHPSDEKFSSAQPASTATHSSTPLLSHSRTPTPTTPGSPLTRSNTGVRDDDGHKAGAEATKDKLSPTAALESLRVLENSFDKSSPNSPLEAAFTKDSDHSQSTVVASPARPATGEAETTASPVRTSSISSRPGSKRSSSYRKSVPTLDELDAASRGGLALSGEGSQRASSATSSSERAASPSSATTDTPSWISSLTTLEAIRVLAFQHSVHEAPSTPPPAARSEAGASTDEVAALRFSLSFALARADKLAESLNRASEDKVKLETELEILRRNVLSMLGSRNMFTSPMASPSLPNYESSSRRHSTRQDIVEEDDGFEPVRAGKTPAVEVGTGVAPVARPPRAGRLAKAAEPAAAAPAPRAGVSIASLRKKNAAAAAIGTTQRYEPPARKGAAETDAYETEEEDEDEEDGFDMYPFGAPVRRKDAPEVSMSDFLNASRMSKTEIEEHDARRELEEAVSSYTASISSHAPLAGGYAGRSTDPGRRGFFKGITKLVDLDRSKRLSRRSSLASKPSLASIGAGTPLMARSTSTYDSNRSQARGFALYDEESIIPPSHHGNRRRGGNISLDSSLRESIERHSLRDAGILA